MATVRKTQTLNYDKYMNTRQRTLRFLQDNKNTYLDYPTNTQRRVDLEDVKLMDYYSDTLGNYCFYGGLFGTILCGAAVLVLHRMHISRAVKIVSVIIPLFPMIGSTFLHYQSTGRFLDYCAVKYEERGLYDTELWDYHKRRHGQDEIVSDWSIGK